MHSPNATTPYATRARARARRGFTIIEAMIVLGIIALLAGILVVGVSKAIRGVREQAETQMLRSLVIAAGKFKEDFKFVPPLVQDSPPGPVNAADDPLVRDDKFLIDPEGGGGTVADLYSELSLTYYLLGACGKDVDGIDGFGFTAPVTPELVGSQYVGAFSRRGQKYEPFIDLSKGKNRVQRSGSDPDRGARILDRWNTPVRYYRWDKSYFNAGQQKGEVKTFGIPPGAFPASVWKEIIKNSSTYLPMTSVAVREKAQELAASIAPQLRGAEFAVVSAGPDGQINDAPTNVAEASKNLDNLVEVGP